MLTTDDLTICTWFVADDTADATFFPQIGMSSAAPAAQAIYWRCIVAFFASSVRHNRRSRHMLFANVPPPSVDGIDLATMLADLGVEVVLLPITWRLPRGTVASWGNQFYVFDILTHIGRDRGGKAWVILDSDCVWTRPADELVAAIGRHGAVTYDIDDEYAPGADINGSSSAAMARFADAAAGRAVGPVKYCGGEFFAADLDHVDRVMALAVPLWRSMTAGVPDAPREEAHLLSVIYAVLGVAIGTGNGFIKRMWTTFHHNTVAPGDRELMLWHLPAEKKTGFRDLFAQLTQGAPASRERALSLPALSLPELSRTFGIPRRGAVKLIRDLSVKIAEKLRRKSG